jgi:metal-responsive CopG/Arc/MetJ family transcriptional regulator
MKTTVEVKISLPVVLAAELELRLWDPLRERVLYGARSKLITKLLREHFAKGIEEKDDDGH